MTELKDNLIEDNISSLDNPQGFLLDNVERQSIIDEVLGYLDTTDGILNTTNSTVSDIGDDVDTINTDGVTNAKILVDEDLIAQIDGTSKEILKDFNFGTTDYAGAVKAGDLLWNQTTGAITSGSGVAVYRGGIVGAKNGVPKFTLTTSGDATFAGTLSAATGTFSGDISAASGRFTGTVLANNLEAGTIIGSTVKATGGSGTDVWLQNDGQLLFRYGSNTRAYMYCDSAGRLIIDADYSITLQATGTGDDVIIKADTRVELQSNANLNFHYNKNGGSDDVNFYSNGNNRMQLNQDGRLSIDEVFSSNGHLGLNRTDDTVRFVTSIWNGGGDYNWRQLYFAGGLLYGVGAENHESS